MRQITKYVLMTGVLVLGHYSIQAQSWNTTGDNSTTGSLTIGSDVDGTYSRLLIKGPNSPIGVGSKRNIIFDFRAAGQAHIRSYRGSSYDTYLQFLTNDYSNSSGTPAVRMHINGNGNVGIGSTSPGAKLEVGVEHAANQSEALRLGSYFGGNFLGIGFNYRLSEAGSVSKHIVEYHGETEYTAMTFNKGKIGIGTNTPSQKLEIADGSILVKSDPYAFIGLEKSSGATLKMGISSEPEESFLSSNGTLKFLTNGEALPRMFIDANGKVGVGTKTPSQKFEIKDGSFLIKSDPYAFIGLERSNGASIKMGVTSGGTEAFVSSKGTLKFLTAGDAAPKMFISYNGNVGIGTNNATDLLTVAGRIHSREVKVTVNAGADFVFENDYKLPSLEETSEFVRKNKHLPEIPSEKEMIENGLELGEMNIKLLQKVEELTLYLIEQNDVNKAQADEIAELRQRLSKLEE